MKKIKTLICQLFIIALISILIVGCSTPTPPENKEEENLEGWT